MSAEIHDFSLTFQSGRSPYGARRLRQGRQRRPEHRTPTRRHRVERTFTDKASGKDTIRPRLDEMLAFVRDGDTVIVHSMDRLGPPRRNLDDLRRVVRSLTGKGVQVEFVKERLAFTGDDSPMATLLLSVMGAFAEFERALILERQREGVAAAKLRGVYTGRKPALTDTQADQLRQRAAAGERKSLLAKEFGVS